VTELPDLLPDLVAYQSRDPSLAIDAAVAAVRSHCGWHISPSISETVSIWSPGGRSVFVKTRNLTAVTSVTQDGVAINLATVTFTRYGKVARYPGYVFSRLTPVSVGITHGYATLPDDARDVILAVAQRSISDTRGLVARPGTAGIFVETFGPNLTDGDKKKLAPYTISAGFA